MKLEIYEFGQTKNKEGVLCYKFFNENICIEILSYGGIIKTLKTPNKNGVLENIVLGFDSLEEYEENPHYFGAIIGRNAGRLKDAILPIDDTMYPLEKNNENNNLHGGINALSKKVWNGFAEIENNDTGILTLTYTSPHLENGFPGNVKFKVTYKITSSALEIDYLGVPDRKTYINMTNHTYFNLTGNLNKTIDKELFKIVADEYIKIDSHTLPTEKESIGNLLKNGSALKEIFSSNNPQITIAGNGLDHPFILKKNQEFSAQLTDTDSGRILKVKTNQPCIVVYTGNYLPIKHSGICFETQNFPDYFNYIHREKRLFNKDYPYSQKTTFYFK